MALTCQCPASTALPTIPKVTCAQSFGQIQKVVFQRIFDDDGEKNYVAYNLAPEKSTWTALMAAVDSTKIVISPYLNAPTSEAGSARTFGGGNETLGGIEQIVGREPTPFSAVMRSVPQSVIKTMKELQCEAEAGNLGVFLIDENGYVEAIGSKITKSGQETNVYMPIPIRSLFVGDKTHGGLEAPDSNAISWSFLPNFSDDLIIAKVNFNPLDL